MRYAPTTTLAGLLLLITGSVVSGWVQRSLDPEPIPWRIELGSAVRRAAEEAGIDIVDTEEARRIMEEETRLVLDARAMADYDREHLPSALSLPVDDFEAAFPNLLPILTPDMPLMVYCGGPDCDDALRLAERLREAGFPEVVLYLEGMKGWTGGAP